MKKILILLLLISSAFSYAANYTVGTGGTYTTITQVNSAWLAGTFNAGDSILFKRGENFYGGLVVSEGGTTGNPIVVGAYGTGTNPIITGFTTLTSWTNEGGGIYSKAVTCESNPNLLVINGIQYGMGRYPNIGTYLTYESFSTSVSITDNQTNSSVTDWTGAEIFIRKNAYRSIRATVTSHSGTTFIYTSLGTTENGTANHYYFVQNDLRTLDQFGEWYYGSGKMYVYFGDANPATYTIKVPTINNLIVTANKNYTNVTGITFEGANSYIVSNTNSHYMNINNCEFHNGGDVGIYFDSQYGTIKNCTLTDIVRDAIWSIDADQEITNNIVKRIGVNEGLAAVGGRTCGMRIAGNNILIKENIIDSTAYHGIIFGGAYDTIVNNSISNFCLHLNDGGGIYTDGVSGTIVGKYIDGNIVSNGYGKPGIPTNSLSYAHGIYLDNSTSDLTAINNSVSDCSGVGFFLSNNKRVNILNNTAYNCATQLYLLEFTTGGLINIVSKNNKLVAKESTQRVCDIQSNISSIVPELTSDSNYFARPVNDNQAVYAYEYVPFGNMWTSRTLAQWQTYSSQDAHSNKSPVTLTDSRDITFRYNPTISDSLLSFEGERYYLIDGSRVTDTLTIAAYSSVVLLRDNSYAPTPEILATVYLYEPLNIASRQVTISSLVSNDGGGTISERGIVYSTSPNPTTANNKITNGSGLGSYTTTLSGLVNATTYYVRAYAINEAGTSYSSQVTVRTKYSSYINNNGYILIDDGKILKY